MGSQEGIQQDDMHVLSVADFPYTRGKTERERQLQNTVVLSESGSALRWHFTAGDGSFTCSAIAPSESGAFRVCNAEHPGTSFHFTDATFCKVDRWPAHIRKAACRVWGLI